MDAKKRRFPISLVMIVRDEEATLGRCLDSVRGLVDEIVVVDTGSVDRTVEIAASYGAVVGHFDWVDDFAAARNEALARATHPWRLVLDADDWILDREQAATILAEIGSRAPTFLGAIGSVQIREDGSLNTDAEPFDVPRLLPRQATYAGRIHEQPVPDLPVVRLGLLVGHSGYTDAALARKGDRNAALLTAAIEADPDDAYLWYQLGCEYVVRRGHAEGLPCLVQSYNLLHPEDAEPEPLRTWSPRLVQRLILALTATGHHEDAVALGAAEAGAWADCSDFHYVYGQAQRALALSLLDRDEARAAQLVASSLQLWLRAVELGDRPEYGGVLAQRATVMAARLVAEDYETMGRAAEAARYRAIA